jgi:hypothetical protein
MITTGFDASKRRVGYSPSMDSYLQAAAVKHEQLAQEGKRDREEFAALLRASNGNLTEIVEMVLKEAELNPKIMHRPKSIHAINVVQSIDHYKFVQDRYKPSEAEQAQKPATERDIHDRLTIYRTSLMHLFGELDSRNRRLILGKYQKN